MRSLILTAFTLSLTLSGATRAQTDWEPTPFAPADAHAPTPLPDRVVLTWADDPATTQSVTWRTDVSVKQGLVQVALASGNGRAMQPREVPAATEAFTSDINEAHYHSATIRDLEPDTLYAYRVGDGVNWTEYYHFKTASDRARPFSFIYFGDAQNDVRTHWSRVFREAFRDAPRAAFTLHAGDLIDHEDRDGEWGDWHQGPDWVNGTIPMLALPGNHEYRRVNQGPQNERYWNTRSDGQIEVVTTAFAETSTDQGTVYSITVAGPDGTTGDLTLSDGGVITSVSDGVTAISGFTAEELLGTSYYRAPLFDHQRDRGDPAISLQWRPQFAFPVQDIPNDALAETVYYIDYQGTRLIALNSNEDTESQVAWLRNALENNPNRWTVVTFHTHLFSGVGSR